LALLGVKLGPVLFGESLYNTGKIEACLKKLDDMGLISYKARVAPPKGKAPEDWGALRATLVQIHRFPVG